MFADCLKAIRSPPPSDANTSVAYLHFAINNQAWCFVWVFGHVHVADHWQLAQCVHCFSVSYQHLFACICACSAGTPACAPGACLVLVWLWLTDCLVCVCLCVCSVFSETAYLVELYSFIMVSVSYLDYLLSCLNYENTLDKARRARLLKFD